MDITILMVRLPWQDNNYAEIYAKQNNKQTIIYSITVDVIENILG